MANCMTGNFQIGFKCFTNNLLLYQHYISIWNDVKDVLNEQNVDKNWFLTGRGGHSKSNECCCGSGVLVLWQQQLPPQPRRGLSRQHCAVSCSVSAAQDNLGQHDWWQQISKVSPFNESYLACYSHITPRVNNLFFMLPCLRSSNSKMVPHPIKSKGTLGFKDSNPNF